MASVRVKYVIEWETEVEIPEGYNDIQKYSRHIAAKRFKESINDGTFFSFPTEIKSIDFVYIGKKFPIGQGWSKDHTKLIASNHGYEKQLNQNPFEKNDIRYEIYELAYKAGYNER